MSALAEMHRAACLVAVFASLGTAFRAWSGGRSRVAMSAAPRDVLLEVALNRAAPGGLVPWLQEWCQSMTGDGVMPMRTEASEKGARMRFVALPEDGVNCCFEGPGTSSPFGLILVERVTSSARAGQAGQLACDVEERLVRRLRRDVDLRVHHDKHALDSDLYAGDYGPEMKRAARELLKDAPPPEEEESVRKMFEKGEQLARLAAEARGVDSNTDLFEQPAGFAVKLGPDLQGGIDILAGPGDVGAAEADEDHKRDLLGFGTAVSADAVEPSPEIAVRFEVLVREAKAAASDSVQFELVLDAYRDVLLDPAFATLTRRAMSGSEDPEALGPILERLNAKVLELATQLAEMARFAERQHLETVKLACEAAKKGDLDVALKSSLRPRLDSDFIAYLAFAIDREPKNSDFRLVLESVRNAVYSELSKDLRHPIDVFDTVLNLKDEAVRAEVLRLNLENMGPNTLAHFLYSARKIFDNLLVQKRTPIDPYFAARLIQLRQDLLRLKPNHAPAYLLDDNPPFPTSPATTVVFDDEENTIGQQPLPGSVRSESNFGNTVAAPHVSPAPSTNPIPGTDTHLLR